MKTLASLTLALSLAVALTACGDNLGGGDDTGGEGSGSGSGSGSDEPAPKLDATGTYRLNSTFDIATNMPGSSGSFVNGLIAATDDPDDPMSWLLDQMLDQMPSGTLKSILQGAKPIVAGYLNDQLTQLAPDLVGTILELGHHMEDMTKHFGVNEKLVIAGADQTLLATLTADGVRFTVDANQIDVAFADYNVDDVVASGVLIQIENESKMLIGEHALPLPYGKIVRMGLDTAIIPTIDPNAHNLADLLGDVVDCTSVGQGIADALDFGSASFWTSACTAGLNGAANLVYDQIAAKDSLLTFHLTGNARVSDGNGDHKLDKIQFGTWAGTLSYDATDTALVQPASFDGHRE
ncbi:MAG TPA: hypothetical protein VFV99_14235 [Kofleriaceae bacterium]|nr:hypothetical protein [Kofleriaceae bacterium]